MANCRLGHILQCLHLDIHNVCAHHTTDLRGAEFRIFDGCADIYFGFLDHNFRFNGLQLRKLLLLPQNGRHVLFIYELVVARSILDHYNIYNRPFNPSNWLQHRAWCDLIGGCGPV